MRFAFENYRDRRGRNIGIPRIDLTLDKGGVEVPTSAILDSGAEVSLFDSKVAEELGIVLEDGEPTPIVGIGGYGFAYAHVVNLTVSSSEETLSIPCRVLFQENVRENLIGREDFFETFRITFARHEAYIQLDQALEF